MSALHKILINSLKTRPKNKLIHKKKFFFIYSWVEEIYIRGGGEGQHKIAIFIYSWFHEKGSFSGHSFNEDYPSIPECIGSRGIHFQEISGILLLYQEKKKDSLTNLPFEGIRKSKTKTCPWAYNSIDKTRSPMFLGLAIVLDFLLIFCANQNERSDQSNHTKTQTNK